jgi:NADH-quinone oxidoreductase subunit E
MLTSEEKQEMQREMERYQDKRALIIEGLKALQRHRGWLSNETILDLAQFLDMTCDELDSVATFYSLLFRRPVGRHVILMCDSVSCWLNGYENLRNHIQTKLGIGLGDTTPEQRFTFLPIVCLGACGGAPAIMIDGDLHENLDPEKIDRILERYP